MSMAPPRRAALPSLGTIRREEMRCVRCRHLLQKVERDALRVGKSLEIKCPHCKVINYLVGMSADTFGERQQAVSPHGK
jgi:phage FluMu protein Com